MIIEWAFDVFNEMRFNFLESVYEKCMLVGMQRAGLDVKAQFPIKVQYRGQIVGDFVADLFVEGRVIVELKSAATKFSARNPVVNYLVATGTDVGLLINFGESGVEVKRKVRTLEK